MAHLLDHYVPLDAREMQQTGLVLFWGNVSEACFSSTLHDPKRNKNQNIKSGSIISSLIYYSFKLVTNKKQMSLEKKMLWYMPSYSVYFISDVFFYKDKYFTSL